MKRIYDNAIDKNVAKVVLFIGDDDKIYYTDPAEDENAQEVPAEEALNLFLKEMVGFKSSDGTYVNPVSCTTDGELSFKSSGGGSGGGVDAYRIKMVYDEETEDVSYIADVPFLEVEKTPAFAIVYETTEDGEVVREDGYIHEENFMFNQFSFNATSSPNLHINVLYHDPEDETGRVFINEQSSANITVLD